MDVDRRNSAALERCCLCHKIKLRGSVILKSHLLVRDETSVLLSTPEGYANKSRPCESRLNNKYLQGHVERHSTQLQQQTKNLLFCLRDINLMS